jgi:L-ascorbate metabolism protein UlaG (beta-lactamase superfamily)
MGGDCTVAAMELGLIRHATLRVDVAGVALLVDPMLAPAGAYDPVVSTANPRRNPLVDLPVPAPQVVDGLDGVLVTHLHNDHFDPAAVELLDPRVALACQPDDEATLRGRGFTDVRPVEGAIDLSGVGVARTAGRHGTGDIGERMGPVSGFVLRAPGEPVLYVAGDTIWCDEVEQALAEHDPDVVVVNAGAARFLEGDPITMDADDVIETARAARGVVVAVHMEAMNHCALTRAALRDAVAAAGVEVLIPADGERLEL